MHARGFHPDGTERIPRFTVNVNSAGQQVNATLAMNAAGDFAAAYEEGLRRLRIIHGKGTGVLRAAVRKELTKHPLVKRAREGEPGEGGDGVTVAYLVGQ